MEKDTSHQHEIPIALYHATLGKMVLDYMGRMHPAVIQQAIESRAVQTLEAIRFIMENKRLDDQQCCERIDQLITLFFQELEVKVDRHSEQE